MTEKKNDTKETEQLPTSEESVLEEASGAAGTDQSQEKADAEIEKGYRGVSPDPNPDEHYTLQGVIKRAKEGQK